jgi:hypothetical protein
MTYREAELDEPCVECAARCTTRCTRCRTPACAPHLFTDDQVCRSCEEEFLRRGTRLPFSKPMKVVAGVAMGGMLLMVALPAMGFGVVAACLVVLHNLARFTPARVTRVAFLAELSTPKALPPGSSG